MSNQTNTSGHPLQFRIVTPKDTSLRSDSDAGLNLFYLNGPKACKMIADNLEYLFLPPYTIFLAGKDTSVDIDLPADGQGLVFFFNDISSYCQSNMYEEVSRNDKSYTNSYSVLPMTDALRGFYSTMVHGLSDLFTDSSFCNSKCKELCFIVGQYLHKIDYPEFLHPVIAGHDSSFRTQVLENYAKSYRVKELAAELGYTEKAFAEKFKAEFGVTPKSWITEQVLKTIMSKMADPDISFKEIAEDLQMSSLQAFSRFCKSNLGLTPTQIREEMVRK